MRDPSRELVDLVRRKARSWARRHHYPQAELDDVEGDALEWLARYEPPAGYVPEAAVLWKLPRILATCARDHRAHRGPRITDDLDELGGRAGTLTREIAIVEHGYAIVDLDDAIARSDLTQAELEAVAGTAAGYTLRELAERDQVTESALCHRRKRARSRLQELPQ